MCDLEKLVIRGGKPLIGEIEISGAKNAAVAILPATLLAKGEFIIDNLPNISDIDATLDILRHLGAEITRLGKHTVRINTMGVTNKPIPEFLACKLRASYYFLGALLGRFGSARVAMPGGCNFGGVRPIDLHIKGFNALGATVGTDGEYVVAQTTASTLMGNTVFLDKPSVGATINVILAAVGAKGITIIENAAKEPHIVDIANFLNRMGAEVRCAGTERITIIGGLPMKGCEHIIIPDQIETGTYMTLAAATRGQLTLKNITSPHLDKITAKLRECGATVIPEEVDSSEQITVSATGRLKCCDIKAEAHPGFPTDMQPQFTALLSICEGTSMVTDSVWDNRFKYTDQLTKMGAQIKVSGNTACIQGTNELTGASVFANDLRAGAALIIAALAAKGTTTIGNISYIDRGYEDIVEKLSAVGADIQRVEFPDVPPVSNIQKVE